MEHTTLAEEKDILRAKPIYSVSRQRLEVTLTLITLLSGLGAYWANRAGMEVVLVTGLYLAAYAAGSYIGVEQSLILLKRGDIDINILMILAALGAGLIGQPAEGTTLLFLFSLSSMLESFAMDRSRNAISKLMDLRPKTANVRRGNTWIDLPVEQLMLEDVIKVRPGERFPIDGIVIEGSSDVDQAPITGESIPVEKQYGDTVFAGTVNGNGALVIKVSRLTEDTTLARIVRMVEEAQENKASPQRALDRLEKYYSIFILSSAAILIIIPILFFSVDFYASFYRGMIWLVVASPCALVISTPASILSAIANGARNGILFKGGAHLEEAAALKVVAFDKTGTLTTGKPILTTINASEDVSENKLLRIAAAAEGNSEHHLAKAILAKANERGIEYPKTEKFQALPGLGVEAFVEGEFILIGNLRLFKSQGLKIPQQLETAAQDLESKGITVMLVNASGEWLGLLGVEDTLRADAAQTIVELKSQGIERVVMLTGDNDQVAKNIADQVGIDEYYANLMPDEKVEIIQSLGNKYGPIAMIGDGVNDAPALAAANLGVAMGGAGTDVALEVADIVLMADSLTNLPHTIGLAKQARRVVWQNLTFSMAVIVILVIATFAADLPLPLGVVGHEGSTVIVVLNGLRLLGYRG